MAEEQKKYTLSNFTIRDVQKADGIKEKTGKPWLRFKFKTTDPQAKDREFTYFPYSGLTHPETWPYEGVTVTSMTFTITEEGQYAGDCNVKKLTLDPASKPPPAEEDPFAPSSAPSGAPSETIPLKSETIPRNNETIGKEPSVCTSYAMELMKGLLIQGLSPKDADEALPIVCDSVARNGYILYATLKASMEKEREIK